VFRINMSHTSHDAMRKLHAAIRAVEKEFGRPIGILADLQGPKLRVGTFKSDAVMLRRRDLRARRRQGAGRRDARAPAASRDPRGARAGHTLLLDDGKVRLTRSRPRRSAPSRASRSAASSRRARA
jgi:pyruvate kinase